MSQVHDPAVVAAKAHRNRAAAKTRPERAERSEKAMARTPALGAALVTSAVTKKKRTGDTSADTGRKKAREARAD